MNWRNRQGLPANAIRGGQSVQKSGYKIVNKAGKKQTLKGRKLSARKLAEEAERAVVKSLPTKEETYKKVRDSPLGQITTKQLIEQGYGDAGKSRLNQGGRGDTIHKLRILADKDGLLELDTSEGQIIWRA